MQPHFISNSDTVHSDNETELKKINAHLSEGLQVKRWEQIHLFSQEHVWILLCLGFHIKRTETVCDQLCAIGDPRGDDNEDKDGRNVSSLWNELYTPFLYQVHCVGEGKHTRSNTGFNQVHDHLYFTSLACTSHLQSLPTCFTRATLFSEEHSLLFPLFLDNKTK